MTTSSSANITVEIDELQIKQVLDSITEEYYHQNYNTKKELIIKAAKKLDELGIPKKMIALELVRHRAYLRFLNSKNDKNNKRVIYESLKEHKEYSRDYESDVSSLIDDNNIIEQEAKNVRAIHDIPEGERPQEEDRYYELKNKILDLKYDNKGLLEELRHYKNLFETGMDSGAIDKNKMCHEVAISSDMYDELKEMMEKSPFGIIIFHDGFNATKIKSMKFRKPTEGREN